VFEWVVKDVVPLGVDVEREEPPLGDLSLHDLVGELEHLFVAQLLEVAGECGVLGVLDGLAEVLQVEVDARLLQLVRAVARLLVHHCLGQIEFSHQLLQKYFVRLENVEYVHCIFRIIGH